MRNLIIGSEGYVGSHLQRVLNAETLDIKGSPDYRIDIRSNFSFIKEYDNVIFLAALVKVNESEEQPFEYYKTNIYGLINVLEKIKTKNFIFASSCTAEDAKSVYAKSKKIGEEIVEDFCRKRDINYTVFRFYNIIGSHFGIKPTNQDGLLHNLLLAAATGEFNIFGNDYNTKDGTPVRDYIDVMEVCHAIIKAIVEPANRIEDIGSGNPKTVLEMADIFKKVNNVNFKINIKNRRAGDLESSTLKYKSPYYNELYPIEEKMKVKELNHE